MNAEGVGQPPVWQHVPFGDVPVGGWFKEAEGGAWHFKCTPHSARYRASGVDGEPLFESTELVLVDGSQGCAAGT